MHIKVVRNAAAKDQRPQLPQPILQDPGGWDHMQPPCIQNTFRFNLW
jgi:hypothetical protein